MSRTLLPVLTAAVAVGFLCGSSTALNAQTRAGSTPQGPVRPAARQPAGEGVQPAAGVANADLRVPNVPPEIERILEDWSKASGGITELRGEHGRIVYDHVFEVSKHSTGHFYFKGPDKGRIDLNPLKVNPGDPDPHKKNPQGKPYTLQVDQQERWICDGQQILRIDDTKKEMEVFPIPEEARGKNIMEGPLPFLFGMPPDKAKRRFEFKLAQPETDEIVHLHVRPLLAQDAQNWSRAEVMLLKRQDYLPYAVRLFAPSGTEETVYEFKKDTLKIGPQRALLPLPWGQKDPFSPDIPKEYKVTKHRHQQPDAEPPTLPSVVGMHGTRAKNVLEQLKCDILWIAGDVAQNQQLVHTIYYQQPAAGVPLQPGMKVTLTYHVPPAEQPAAEERTAGAQPKTIQVPDVRNLHWEKAKAALERTGYNVARIKWLKGQPAPRADLANVVSDQQPAPGTRITADTVVQIVVYLAPATASRRE